MLRRIIKMKAIKTLTALALTLVIGAASLVGCGAKTEDKKTEKTTVKIGITGDNTEEPNSPWTYVKKELAKENINIEFVAFGDYNRPNLALSDGEIDLNSYQHIAFLETFKRDHKVDIVPIGNTNLAPMGIYSKKIKTPSEIKEKGKVLIPNDKSNGGRALLLLQAAGLLKLKDNVGFYPTVKDIIENKKNLEIVEIVATQIPRSLEDVELAVINNGVAVTAKLDPIKDPIFLEDANSPNAKPYINVIAARGKDKDNKVYKRIVEVYNTDEVKKITKEYYKNSVIPAW